MLVLKPRKKIISEFKDAKMSRADLIMFFECVKHDKEYNPFNHDIPMEVIDDLIRGLACDHCFGYAATLNGKSGTEAKLISYKVGGIDKYRFKIVTNLDSHKQNVTLLVRDDVLDEYWTATLKEGDLFDMDLISFEGTDEEWDEVEDY